MEAGNGFGYRGVSSNRPRFVDGGPNSTGDCSTLRYLKQEEADGLYPDLENVGRVLNGLMRSLDKKLKES